VGERIPGRRGKQEIFSQAPCFRPDNGPNIRLLLRCRPRERLSTVSARPVGPAEVSSWLAKAGRLPDETACLGVIGDRSPAPTIYSRRARSWQRENVCSLPLLTLGNKKGSNRVFTHERGNGSGRKFGNSGRFHDERGQRRYVLFGVAVLVATGAFKPTKVLHK
jgi:hypothetical protein